MKKYSVPLLVVYALFLSPYWAPSISARSSQSIPSLPHPMRSANPGTKSSGTSYYLYPHNLHLTSGTTSSVPLIIIDDQGDQVAGTPVFYGYDPTLISISGDGFVTALRPESSAEIGTWVHAALGGVEVASTAIVRVLSEDYEIPFSRIVGETTVLYYPTCIDGEDLSAYVTQYEIPTVNEYAYSIQDLLMGVRPFDGARQVFEVDFGENEAQRVCGISGNPIRIGWNIEGNEWQNCFLVPFNPPRSPQWGIFYHEMGHNFTWASETFGRSLGIFEYSEGIATTLSLTSMNVILDNPLIYLIGTKATTSLRQLVARDELTFLNDYQDWMNAGADFGKLNPNIVDGIWLHHREECPQDFAQRFFQPLQPQYAALLSSVLDSMGGNDEHTMFAALVSAAMGSDLSGEFSGTYHYPIDTPLFNSAYPLFESIMDGELYQIYLPALIHDAELEPVLLNE